MVERCPSLCAQRNLLNPYIPWKGYEISTYYQRYLLNNILVHFCFDPPMSCPHTYQETRFQRLFCCRSMYVCGICVAESCQLTAAYMYVFRVHRVLFLVWYVVLIGILGFPACCVIFNLNIHSRRLTRSSREHRNY